MTIAVANRRDVPTLRAREGEGPVHVYVGRPSPLGNPYRIGPDGDRERVIARFSHWLYDQLRHLPAGAAAREFDRLLDLARAGDLVLVCHCAPLPCHAEVIKGAIEATLAGEVGDGAHRG